MDEDILLKITNAKIGYVFGLPFEEVKKAIEEYKFNISHPPIFDDHKIFGKTFGEIRKALAHYELCKDNNCAHLTKLSGESHET